MFQNFLFVFLFKLRNRILIIFLFLFRDLVFFSFLIFLSVLNDRAQGGTSLIEGEIEIMI